MDNTQWLLIILLVLLIAVGIWMLMRKPASGQDRSPAMGQDAANDQSAAGGGAGAGVSSYDAGGEHVAAGETGVAPGPALYDQEADARTEEDLSPAGYDEASDDEVTPDEVWDGADPSEPEGARQDTATGADVPIVEDEPVVSEDHEREALDAPFDQHDEDSAPEADPVEQIDPFGQVDNGDRDQMSYGEPHTEDFASETTYAEAPAEGTLQPVADSPAEPHDLGTASPGTSVHDEMLDLENEQALVGDESDGDEFVHHGAGSENLGPEEGEGDAGEDRDEDLGHPGPSSQPGDDATYAPIADHGAGSENLGPEEGEGDTSQVRDPDQGHPGPASQMDDDDATYGIPVETSSDEHDDVPEDAAAAGFVADDHEPSDEHPAASDPEEFAVEDASDALVVDGADQVAEPVEAEQHGDEEPEAVMVNVDDYSATTEAPEADPVEDDRAAEGHGTDDEPEAEQDHDAEHSDRAESEHHDAVVESKEGDNTDEQHGDEEPEVVMVNVDDYSATTEAHEADTVEGEGTEQDFEDDESTSFEQPEESDADADTASEVAEAPVVEDEPIVVDGKDATWADDDAEESEPSEPAVVASPYGPGSVFPNDDGSVPSGYDIKGNAGSMLFHTPESPSYETSVPEVYFNSEDAARAAGFAHWDRKRR